MPRVLISIFIWISLSVPSSGQATAEFDRLINVLGLPEIIEIMRLEGVGYGDELATEMFPDPVGGRWQEMVARIYDPERIRTQVFADFEAALDPVYIEPLVTFFESPVGKEVIALEISARRALLDDELADANDVRVVEFRKEQPPRLGQLQEFIAVNDLLETNVVGALNSNYAFFSGLVEGGAYGQPMSQDDILREVWSQEDDIRTDTETWLIGYLYLAYSPLDDADMQAYVDYSKTPAGQAMNTALFTGFNGMFEDVSFALGLAAAQMMSSDAL